MSLSTSSPGKVAQALIALAVSAGCGASVHTHPRTEVDESRDDVPGSEQAAASAAGAPSAESSAQNEAPASAQRAASAVVVREKDDDRSQGLHAHHGDDHSTPHAKATSPQDDDGVPTPGDKTVASKDDDDQGKRKHTKKTKAHAKVHKKSGKHHRTSQDHDAEDDGKQ